MQIRALALLSGGLDSALAAKIVLDQGVEVEALHCVNAFLAGKEDGSGLQRRLAEQLCIGT